LSAWQPCPPGLKCPKSKSQLAQPRTTQHATSSTHNTASLSNHPSAHLRHHHDKCCFSGDHTKDFSQVVQSVVLCLCSPGSPNLPTSGIAAIFQTQAWFPYSPPSNLGLSSAGLGFSTRSLPFVPTSYPPFGRASIDETKQDHETTSRHGL